MIVFMFSVILRNNKLGTVAFEILNSVPHFHIALFGAIFFIDEPSEFL